MKHLFAMKASFLKRVTSAELSACQPVYSFAQSVKVRGLWSICLIRPELYARGLQLGGYGGQNPAPRFNLVKPRSGLHAV